MTSAMLTQGAGDWDADAVAERMEDVGATLSAASLRDMAVVTLRSLTQEPALETALTTLIQVLSNPRFAAPDLERVRQNTLTALRQAEQDPADRRPEGLLQGHLRDPPLCLGPHRDTAGGERP